MKIIGAIGRWFGLVNEQLHHVEAAAVGLADRYEAVAVAEAKKVEGYFTKITDLNALHDDAVKAGERAKAQAKKIRDFFA